MRVVCRKPSISFSPEQFTVKAHPALFEGEGRGRRGSQILRHYIFLSTIDINIQNQTLESNISRTVRDREKKSIEVR